MAMVATIAASVAVAGGVQPFPVEVTVNPDLSGAASGDMVTARFSNNDFEMIGCGIRTRIGVLNGEVAESGFCQARDSEKESGFCFTTRSDLLDTIKATADFSFVSFSWDENGECSRIGFSTQSLYIPEQIGPGNTPKQE